MPTAHDLSDISLGAMAPSLTPLGPDAQLLLDASLVIVVLVLLLAVLRPDSAADPPGFRPQHRGDPSPSPGRYVFWLPVLFPALKKMDATDLWVSGNLCDVSRGRPFWKRHSKNLTPSALFAIGCITKLMTHPAASLPLTWRTLSTRGRLHSCQSRFAPGTRRRSPRHHHGGLPGFRRCSTGRCSRRV